LFAPQTIPTSRARAGTRVAVGPSVPAIPARGATDGFRKYLPTRRLGASRVIRVASARVTSGEFAGRARHELHEDATFLSSTEQAQRARASAPPAHRFAWASAMWRRARNVVAAFSLALAFGCVAASPATAFGGSFGGSSAHASSYSSAAFLSPSHATASGFSGVGDSPSSVYAMKNLPVAVGDIGSLGMLGSPAGIGIPYHGKNPGIALFMASGGVAVRMLINVVVIYAIHKYWMGGDE
jgi:hypothetical protein